MTLQKLVFKKFYLLLLLSVVSSGAAHEYWLDLTDASVQLGRSALVNIRNGENFIGASFPYDSSGVADIRFSGEGENEAYAGRLGDYPAINRQMEVGPCEPTLNRLPTGSGSGVG